MATSATYGIAKYGDSLYGRVNITANAGSYTLTGGAATLKVAHVLSASTGNYALTGVAQSLRYARLFTASAGAYSITGKAASTLKSSVITGNAGSYAYTGSTAGFIHNEVIYAGTWNFHITGYPANLLFNHSLVGSPGAYTLTGGTALLQRSLVLGASVGAYALTGKDANLLFSPNVQVQTTGGVDKKVKTKIKKSQRDEVEATVREAFDKMDGTYVPPKVIQEIQKEVKREIKQIDLTQYDLAMAQVNALLLQAQAHIHAYEAELDDEESLLMLL